MQTYTLKLITRTPLHVGAGSAIGAIDAPVMRERHTGHPIIPGSSLKGVMRDAIAGKEGRDHEIIHQGFGKEETKDKETKKSDPGMAGAISFGEAQILLFPVRSAKGGFAFVTCPGVLARYATASALGSEWEAALKSMQGLGDGQALAGKTVSMDKDSACVLEDYKFELKGTVNDTICNHLSGIFANHELLKNSAGRIVVLSDGDFAFFVVNTTQVTHHNCIDDETGIVKDGALFNKETVPADSLFFAPLSLLREDRPHAKQLLEDLCKADYLPIIQVGADASTGLGFCSLALTKNA